MPVEIQINREATLRQLTETSKTHPVVMSPHVGNFNLPHLLVSKLGFRHVIVDTNIALIDHLYHPHTVIQDGKETWLVEQAERHRLMTHLRVSKPVNCIAPAGKLLSDVHIGKLKRLFPIAEIESHTDYLKHNIDTVLSVLETATDAESGLWYRKSDSEGNLCVNLKQSESSGITGWRDIRNDVLLPGNRQGWVIPNDLSILLDFIMQSREADSQDVWLISGADMFRYLPKHQALLSRLYDVLAKRLGLRERLVIHVVPILWFKFVVRAAHKRHLDELVELAMVGSKSRQDYGKIAASCPDLWHTAEKKTFHTQHDVTDPADVYWSELLYDVPLFLTRNLWERFQFDTPHLHTH